MLISLFKKKLLIFSPGKSFLSYFCNPMILQKSLSGERRNGVKKGSNSSTFHHFLSADGQLKPSFFLPENHIINKSKYQQQCQSH